MRRLPRAVESDDDSEPDGHFGCGDSDDEENENLRVVIWQAVLADIEAAKGNERQVRRVQHELEAHEDRDDVSPKDDSGKADGKQQSADEEVVVQREAHFSSRLERMTTPIVATRIRTATTWSGRLYLEKRMFPTSPRASLGPAFRAGKAFSTTGK